MKTNKIYLAAFAALALAACSEQDDFTQADVINKAVESASDEIKFGVYVGGSAATRADYDYTGGIIDNSAKLTSGSTASQSLKNAEFGVFSYYTEANLYAHNNYRPNFMYNEHISWSTTLTTPAWTYSPAKYWPNGIDAANAANDPSNTATQGAAHYLSFFAYAPYAAVKESESAYPTSDLLYGDVPVGATTNYIKTDNYTDSRATTHGVVGMVMNSYQQDPWVNYVMKETNGASTTNASGGIDLLWGLRGQYTYDETDNVDNTITSLGNAYNTNLTKQSVPERVRFLFKHALAKIGGSKATTAGTEEDPVQSGLWVVVDVDDNNSPVGDAGETGQKQYFADDFTNEKTLVTIKSVKIQDPFTYYQTEKSSEDTWETSSLNTFGWFNLATGQWANAGHPDGVGTGDSKSAGGATFSLDVTTAMLNPKIKELDAANYLLYNASPADGKKYMTDGNDGWNTTQNPVGVLAKTATKVYSNADNPGVMLIPGSSPQYVYVTVDYVVRTADKKLDPEGDGSKKWTEVEQIITNKVGLANLEANKFYGLLMHLGLTSVKFEAIVADWAGTTDAVYDENGEVIEGTATNTQKVWLPSNVVNTTTIYADAGTSHKHVTVADTQTTYEINLTGLTPGKTVEVFSMTGDGIVTEGDDKTTSAVTYSSGDVVQSDGTAKVTISKLKPNTTTTDVANTIVIKEITTTSPSKTYNEANTTTVTITQTKSVLVLTPSVTSIGPSGSFTVTGTHTNGTAFDLTGYTFTVKINGSTDGSATVDSSSAASGTIKITPSANTTNTPRKVTVEFTKTDCATGSTADNPVIQAPAE